MTSTTRILSDQLIQCAKIIEDLRNEVPVVEDEIEMCLIETSEALEMVAKEDSIECRGKDEDGDEGSPGHWWTYKSKREDLAKCTGKDCTL